MNPFKLFDNLFADKEGYFSRKLIACYFLTIVTTVMVFTHNVTGEGFMTFLNLIWGSYFVANLGEKVTDKMEDKNSEDGEPESPEEN